MDARQRNLLVLGVLGLVALAVGFYLLLLGPLLENLDQQAEAREERRARLQGLEEDVARLEEVRRNSPELQRQLLELNKRIPTQPEFDTLVVQIEDIAEAAEVTQTQVVRGDPAPPEGGGDFTVQPITMSFEGTYEELQDFLTRADALVRLITVNEVNYEISEEGTTAEPEIEQNLLVEIEAEVYYQPTGVPDGTAPVAPSAPETTTAAPEAE
ncbi:MAG: type 4a pilus biogenesis protein PilO [Rubrobacter sp.]|jgi:type IV pilus assembly protein PilO|nr:type 4a pilus biogenesis protein PilO [Rubrobacteraceae bacterium]MBA3795288.1 type 4a pilus biogenesis protein PilO [Rubrobacter sp.]MDQ3317410.1 type 4a pilus biogenesis protein PilO [Actinomycetota bacterium]MDQ3429992.1 type 4a pilus biogenesis protein PilO [Actinomycetota bacterium]